LPLGVEFSLSAVSATVIVVLRNLYWWMPLAAAPLIGGVWGWNKLNKAKVMEAERHLKEQEQLYLRTVESLALAVDAKDQTTYGHIRRVRAYSMGLAKYCGITDPNELMAIETGSLLHDIGKLAIDDYILNKPGRLSKQEFEKMRMHAPAGGEILEQIQFPFPVAKYVRYHHERWDGTGYPDGLKGNAIPLGARILAVADAFDAIRSSRSYKMSFGIDDSIELLRAQSGTIYDPALVDQFLKHIDELESSAEEASLNVPQLSFRQYFEKIDRALVSEESTNPLSSLPQTASAELVSLYEFCNSLGRHLDLQDILPILARKLSRMLPFTTCAFFLNNGEDSIIVKYVVGLFSDQLKNLTIGLGKGISGWVAAYRRPMVNTGPALEFQELEGDFTCLTDALIVPMLVGGECIGTISLYAKAPTFYSQAQLALLQSVARQVGPLISEARTRASTPSAQEILDPVTGTYRANYLWVAGSQMITSAQKCSSPLSLMSLELKNLTYLVSLYGVHAGDTILQKVSEILRGELRETDVLVRFGNEGFIALLPSVRGDQAHRYAQRLQQLIRSAALGNVVGHNLFITTEASVASFPENGTTIYELLESAQHSVIDQLSNIHSDNETKDKILEFPPR
jgi:diguanylate cyclase (GGDEF)-like protein/putative nucleotidyltransferase with HDIG domain